MVPGAPLGSFGAGRDGFVRRDRVRPAPGTSRVRSARGGRAWPARQADSPQATNGFVWFDVGISVRSAPGALVSSGAGMHPSDEEETLRLVKERGGVVPHDHHRGGLGPRPAILATEAGFSGWMHPRASGSAADPIREGLRLFSGPAVAAPTRYECLGSRVGAGSAGQAGRRPTRPAFRS